MTEDLTIPASYDVWLTDLKFHLDRTPGSKAALARYIAATDGTKFSGAQVRVSKILNGSLVPSAHAFIDIAVWLQQQQDGTGKSARLERADEPAPIGPRREVRYTTGSTRRSKVAEE